MKKEINNIAKFPGLFESLYKFAEINCVLLMDANGYVLQVNRAFTTVFGYTEEEIVGKHFRVLYTAEDRKAEKAEVEVKLVLENGNAQDRNYLLHNKGNPIWVTGESILVENKTGQKCILKIVQDIHTQKLQEQFLARSNEFIESILKSMEDALLVINTNLIVQKANKSFFRIFDITEESIERKSLSDLNCQFWQDGHVQNDLKQHFSDNDFSMRKEFEWLIPGGRARTLLFSSKLIEEAEEEEKRILVIINDITHEKQVEQSREDLIAFVSHELRNPLANLALVIDLLKDSIRENNAAYTEEYVTNANINIRRLNKMISELTEATKAVGGQLKIDKSDFAFQKVVEEAIESVHSLYPGYQIIQLEKARETVHADRHRIMQVLNNYLTNAIKYSENGKKIEVSAVVSDHELQVAVKDNGTGIPANQVPHIFNRYYRGESTRKIEGLGLGLYLSKEIIHAHKGRVWVESNEGKGSKFYFSIPLK